MRDHQLWIDTLNMNIQAGKTLQEALLCADALSGWPFRSVNGEQTPESKALEALPNDPKKSVYDVCLETEPEDALL